MPDLSDDEILFHAVEVSEYPGKDNLWIATESFHDRANEPSFNRESIWPKPEDTKFSDSDGVISISVARIRTTGTQNNDAKAKASTVFEARAKDAPTPADANATPPRAANPAHAVAYLKVASGKDVPPNAGALGRWRHRLAMLVVPADYRILPSAPTHIA